MFCPTMRGFAPSLRGVGAIDVGFAASMSPARHTRTGVIAVHRHHLDNDPAAPLTGPYPQPAAD